MSLKGGFYITIITLIAALIMITTEKFQGSLQKLASLWSPWSPWLSNNDIYLLVTYLNALFCKHNDGER